MGCPFCRNFLLESLVAKLQFWLLQLLDWKSFIAAAGFASCASLLLSLAVQNIVVQDMEAYTAGLFVLGSFRLEA